MSQPPDGRVSIDNVASNQGAQGTMRDVTVNNYHAPPLPPNAPRSQMLAKVRSIWIAGVLERSLCGLVQLQPGLRSDPRKVDLPIRALVQEAGGSESERRDRIFRAYVDAMFERRAAGTHWSREETLRLLSWLATQMQRQGQTLFFLTNLRAGSSSTACCSTTSLAWRRGWG